MNSIQKKIATNYWREKLRYNTSTDSTLSANTCYASTASILIEEQSLQYFYKLTSKNHIVEFTVLLSLFNVLLQRYFEECDLVYSNGIMANDETPLLFSFNSIEKKKLKNFLQEVKLEVQEVYKHKEYNNTSFQKDTFGTYTPFGFVYNNEAESNASFSITIQKNENQSLEFLISYAETFVGNEFAENFLQKFVSWVKNLETNLEVLATEIPILFDEEKAALLSQSVSTNNFNTFENQTIISLFEAQATKTPSKVAIEFEENVLTYKQLNEKSNALAHYLRSEKGIVKGDFVGVKLSRTEYLIVSLLAILKAGATYVPIDVNYPEERISYIENDSNCKLVIDKDELNAFLNKFKANEKENLLLQSTSNDLAYIIYTSGTTGNPKGVMITHKNAVALINWAKEEFKNTNFEVVFAATSHCFDLSIFEFFYTLSIGKRIKLLDNSLEIGKSLKDHKNILLNTVPSSIRNILEGGYDLSNVSAVNLAGEPFPVDIAQKLLTYDLEVRNLYGPSEDTTYSTNYKLSRDKEYRTSIPIGKPITYTQAYVLDRNKQLLPYGAVGKLYVTGAGVAKGYLNRPELTTEKFSKDPFCDGQFMYDTGDMAKWLPDGNIEFLGRKDHQVKLRGYRIELGEIETAISQFSDDILQAAVTVKNVKDVDVLAGYYVENKVVNKSELRSYLQEQLPSYMIPGHFIVIDEIPLTANGKVNKKALPEIDTVDVIRNDYVAPTNKTEEKLVDLWEEIIGIKNIGIKDNFFELGGHSLMISLLINRVQEEMSKTIPFRTFYSNPTIENISKSLYKEEFERIEKVSVSDSYPITASQNRLWLLSQLEGGDQAYHVTSGLSLKGKLDVNALKKAFNYVVNRHEVLRTVFTTSEDGIVQQCILPESNFEETLSFKDFSKLSSAYDEVEDYIKEKLSITYDLSRGPLFNASIIQVNEAEFVFFLSMHHIISDGWSMEVLTSELVECYLQLESGKIPSLPNLPIQFKDYTAWLAKKHSSTLGISSEEYWINNFKGELPVLQLPSFKNRPLEKTYSGKDVSYTFSEEVLAKLKSFSKQHHVTLFMTLMAAVKALLCKYTNQKDIIVGTPIAGREHPDLEQQIGLYINTLAIRTQIATGNSFLDVLRQEKQKVLEAFVHQEYPFDKLIEKLDVKRDPSRSPLFEVMVVLQNHQQLSKFKNRRTPEGIVINEFSLEREISQFDLSFAFLEKEELLLTVTFNTDIYDEFFITNIFSHLETLLTQVTTSPDILIDEIDLLGVEERNNILVDFNKTTANYPKDKTIVDVFVEQVNENPTQEALVFNEIKLTYLELDKISNRLANYLLAKYDIKTEDLVGIKLDRSEWSVISILAILKTGAAYVPIDPEYPKQRIEYIEKDCNCKVIVDKNLLEAFDKTQNGKDSLPKVVLEPNNLAYIIYTSGSTGKPKGILVEHKSVVRLVKNTNYIEVAKKDTILGLSSFSFDGSTFDMFMPLLNGASFVVAAKDIFLNLNKFDNLLRAHNVNSFFITTALFNTIVESELGYVKNLKYVLFGGEQVSVKHVRRFKELYPNVKLHHVYGPTENTTYSTYYPVDDLEDNIQTIPIGAGISNSTCYVLDNKLSPVAVGVTGEIYLGGDGLARGYHNRPKLTSEKFINHPFVKGQKLYKTGDLGRWTSKGMIEFMGRKDDQVKIRGYRIELGEIEKALISQDKIEKAVVVVANEKTNPAIVAYIVSSKTVDYTELSNSLSTELPSFMIPNYYINIDSIPLTINGKIDKKKLPKVTIENTTYHNYKAPVTKTQIELVAIWQDVLQKENIGVANNFFELGGHSLMISQIINRVYKRMGKSVSYSFFYNNPTIEKLCDTLEERQFSPINKTTTRDFYPTTPSQQRIWFLSQFETDNHAYHISGAVALYGQVNQSDFVRAFEYVINRHEILYSYFKNNDEGILEHGIADKSEVNLSLLIKDFSNTKSPDKSVRHYIKQEQNKGYNLSVAPLLRASLIKKDNDNFVFFLSMHHIISDGWSLEILTSEIIEAYKQLQLQGSLSLPELPIQFKDYATWLSDKTNNASASRAYWLSVFQGEIPILQLPSTKKRPLIKTYSGNVITHKYSKELLNKLKEFSQKHEVTLFMTLMTSIKTLLTRYSNQEDIIVGTPVAGREHPDLESQVGLYLNTLAIRTHLENADTFLTLLGREKQNLLGAYAHQDLPFDLLVEELNLVRDTSRSPLFDILVVLHNQKQLSGFENRKSLPDFKIKEYELRTDSSQFDMSFSFVEDEDLSLSISYNTDIYESLFINTVFLHLEKVFHQVVSSPEIPLSEIEFITDREKKLVLEEFNNTYSDYDDEATIISLFEEQVLKTPDNVAIISQDNVLTYKQLNECANQLAYYLTQEKEILEGDFVGIKLARNEQLIISLLAVLKAGATYVPIDVNYPEERITYIENDSNCIMVIDEEMFISFDKEQQNYSKDNPKFEFVSSDLAYIIYTSGTTGNPKGVMLTHNNAASFINWAQDEFGSTDFDIVYGATSHCFDLSIFEIFYTLSTGKKIRLLENALEMGEYLNEDHKVLLNTVPSSLRNILENGYDLSNVSAINLAGEPFPIDLAKNLLKLDVEVRNLYGPSEDTTYSTFYKLSKSKSYTSIPIGKPITNSQVYILDENKKLVPPGVIGKLFVSGKGVAKGYLNRSELTSQRFIKNPFKKGTYMYDTGDMAKWLADGNIEFYGRKDNQVKLRGYRIELGEIENAILQFSENISQALVTIKEVNKQEVLVVYFVEKKQITLEKLQQYLKEKLPYYMIPNHFMVIKSVPLTPNGKIDHTKLPDVEPKKITQKEYVAPSNDFEKQLAHLWQEILEVEKVGLTDSFFELGGHSLKITKLINGIYKTFNVKIPTSTLFYNSILKEQSDIIQSILNQENKVQNTEIEDTEIEKFSI
ncbi:amino acid adenylation domain-containing protein [Aquimarina gracilis]|uniref:Amino acid adenylation domain-containing protein n=1 Tax=Aquimarina gracilis TaxID=874422 RepID=A0ABU5ZSE4_9FLAO|nr:non-ribosomal peptide synthetase [Aquimarina gracilis]MEB3344967.1 amino acid adenylation domain-containing protein [Aquimarina gracilis]